MSNPFTSGSTSIDSREQHKKSDLDTGPTAQHHTLGTGPNQAAKGDHTHEAYIVGDIKQSLCADGAWSTSWLPLNGAAIPAAYPAAIALFGPTLPDADNLFIKSTSISADVGDLGGNATTALTTANIPAHAHDAGTLAAAAGGGHTHAETLAVDSGGGHGHAETLAVDAGGGHTHADTLAIANGGAHGHAHTLGVGASGSHNHTINASTGAAGNLNRMARGNSTEDGPLGVPIQNEPNHTHPVTGSVTGAADHAHSITGTITSAAAHTHTISGAITAAAAHVHTISGAITAAATHTHDVTGSTGSIGSGTAFSNEPPFIKMWTLVYVGAPV